MLIFMKCLEHCLAHCNHSLGYIHTCICSCMHTYIQKQASRLENPSLLNTFQQKRKVGQEGPAHLHSSFVLQNRPTGLYPANWLLLHQGGDPHCSAEAGRGALGLRALQEIIGHIAHFIHLVHLILEIHTPVEAVLAEVSFICRREAGTKGMIPNLPHIHNRNKSKILTIIPPVLSRSFQGFHITPSSPPQRYWRAQALIPKHWHRV